MADDYQPQNAAYIALRVLKDQPDRHTARLISGSNYARDLPFTVDDYNNGLAELAEHGLIEPEHNGWRARH